MLFSCCPSGCCSRGTLFNQWHRRRCRNRSRRREEGRRRRNGQGKQHHRAPGTLVIIDQNVKTILPQAAKKQNYTFPNGRRGKIGRTKKAPAKNGLGSNKNKLKQTEKRARQTTPPSPGHTGRNRPTCKNYTAANGEHTKLHLPKRSERQKSTGQKSSGEKWP